MSDRAIGGYFELELAAGQNYHPDALPLNSARHCLEYILRASAYKNIYVPIYTCNVVRDTIEQLGITCTLYRINQDLEPMWYPDLKKDEAFLYTNYFGIKQPVVSEVVRRYGSQAIIDNAQAFYAPPASGIDTFYSPRKFFGVPDGGFLYTDCLQSAVLEQDNSQHRISHLLIRIEQGPEAGYADFCKNSRDIANQPIRLMSRLTTRLLDSIDYNSARKARRDNYLYLHQKLKQNNSFNADIDDEAVPMIYPYLTNRKTLRKELIEKRIFVATYWPGLDDILEETESMLVSHLIPIPIDQRYTQSDMKKIIETIITHG